MNEKEKKEKRKQQRERDTALVRKKGPHHRAQAQKNTKHI